MRIPFLKLFTEKDNRLKFGILERKNNHIAGLTETLENTVVTKPGNDWIAKTAWDKSDFDENTDKILEVIKKHVKE